MSEPAGKGALVIVHGVGASDPGAMLRDLVGELAGRHDTLELDGARFPRTVLDHDARYSEAFECFYADLKPASRGVLAKLTYPLRVLLVVSQIGADGWRGEGTAADRPLVFGRLTHGLLWGLLLSAPSVVFALLHQTMIGGAAGAALGVTACLPLMLTAWALASTDRRLWWAFALSPSLALATVLAVYAGLVNAPAALAARFASAAQIVGGLTVAAALVELIGRCLADRRFRPTAFLVRAGALVMPSMLLSGGAASLLLAFNLLPYRGFDAFRSVWSEPYVGAMLYDLALMEFVLGGATFLFGLFAALGLFVYAAGLRCGRLQALSWGVFARAWARISFAALFVLALMVLGLFAASLVYPSTEAIPRIGLALAELTATVKWLLTRLAGLDEDVTVIEIYGASSQRLVGFAPFLFGPAKLAATVAADVCMYLTPNARANYGAAARDRLGALLAHVRGSHDEVTVAAYSQGSVVALETLIGRAGPTRFVTVGSPVDVLYGAFLGWRPPEGDLPLAWTNTYRASDFIGGPVAVAARNVPVRSAPHDHHLRYFRTPEIQAAVQ